jgi:hypothetical protein
MYIRKKIAQAIRNSLKFLPLAAILVGSALPLPASARPWLIAATLIWFQVFIIFEVFGK